MADKTSSDRLIWRTAGGDNGRRAFFPAGTRIQPGPARSLQVPAAVQASVVFDGEGRVFVADMAGHLSAFSAAGEPVWQTRLSGGISATPAAHPLKPWLFVGTHRGRVCALDTGRGAILWQQEMPTSADPRILSDLLFWPQTEAVVLSSWGGRFRALDAASGAERFSWDAGLSPYGAASASPDGMVYCLRAVHGQGIEFVAVNDRGAATVLHRTPETPRGARRALVAAAPLLDAERGVAYYVVNNDQGGTLHAWSLAAEAILWSRALPHSVQATPSLGKDGVIVVADLGGEVHVFDKEGVLRFRYTSRCDYLLSSAVSEGSGSAFVADPCGVLHVIDDKGAGQVLFEAGRGLEAQPSFDPAGHLYVPSTEHRVWVFPAAAG